MIFVSNPGIWFEVSKTIFWRRGEHYVHFVRCKGGFFSNLKKGTFLFVILEDTIFLKIYCLPTNENIAAKWLVQNPHNVVIKCTGLNGMRCFPAGVWESWVFFSCVRSFFFSELNYSHCCGEVVSSRIVLILRRNGKQQRIWKYSVGRTQPNEFILSQNVLHPSNAYISLRFPLEPTFEPTVEPTFKQS